MRYDLITRDAVAAPDFASRPGVPVTRKPPVVVRGDADRDQFLQAHQAHQVQAEAAVLTDYDGIPLHFVGTPADGEEGVVMPLFPEDQTWDDPNYVPDTSLPPLRGKVRIRLDEVAKRRGLVLTSGRFKGTVNLSAIQRGTGMAYATVYKLLRQPDELTSVSLETLARLCEFFRCMPGDLLVWEPRAEVPQTNISDYFKRQGGGMPSDTEPGGY